MESLKPISMLLDKRKTATYYIIKHNHAFFIADIRMLLEKKNSNILHYLLPISVSVSYLVSLTQWGFEFLNSYSISAFCFLGKQNGNVLYFQPINYCILKLFHRFVIFQMWKLKDIGFNKGIFCFSYTQIYLHSQLNDCLIV